MALYRLFYEGNGVFRPYTESDRLGIMEKFEQGEIVGCDLEPFRSRQQNNTFFAAISYAFANQRQDRWYSSEHLRAWLFVEANFKDTHTFKFPMEPVSFMSAVMGLVTAVRARGSFCFYRTMPNKDVEIDTPKSWRFRSLKHPDAVALMNDVLEIICNEVMPGMTPEALMREVKANIELRKRPAA